MSSPKYHHTPPLEGDSPSNRSWLGSQVLYSDNLSDQDNSHGLYSNSSDDDDDCQQLQRARPLPPDNHDRPWKRSRLGSNGSDSYSSDDHMRSSLNPTRLANSNLPDYFSLVTALTDDFDSASITDHDADDLLEDMHLFDPEFLSYLSDMNFNEESGEDVLEKDDQNSDEEVVTGEEMLESITANVPKNMLPDDQDSDEVSCREMLESITANVPKNMLPDDQDSNQVSVQEVLESIRTLGERIIKMGKRAPYFLFLGYFVERMYGLLQCSNPSCIRTSLAGKNYCRCHSSSATAPALAQAVRRSSKDLDALISGAETVMKSDEFKTMVNDAPPSPRRSKLYDRVSLVRQMLVEVFSPAPLCLESMLGSPNKSFQLHLLPTFIHLHMKILGYSEKKHLPLIGAICELVHNGKLPRRSKFFFTTECQEIKDLDYKIDHRRSFLKDLSIIVWSTVFVLDLIAYGESLSMLDIVVNSIMLDSGIEDVEIINCFASMGYAIELISRELENDAKSNGHTVRNKTSEQIEYVQSWPYKTKKKAFSNQTVRSLVKAPVMKSVIICSAVFGYFPSLHKNFSHLPSHLANNLEPFFKKHIEETHPDIADDSPPPDHTLIIEAAVSIANQADIEDENEDGETSTTGTRKKKKRKRRKRVQRTKAHAAFHDTVVTQLGDDNIKSTDFASKGAKIEPALRVYPGSHHMCITNEDLDQGRGNGTLCKFLRVKLRKDGRERRWKNWDGKKVWTVSIDDVEWMEFEHYPTPTGTKARTFKLKPQEFTATIKIPATETLDITLGNAKVKQIPVNSNIATTGHKLQGMSKDVLIINNWDYRCANWVYVVLSRVRTLAGLYLMKPLDLERSFNVPQSLIRFEQRLRDNKERPILEALGYQSRAQAQA